ncbi:MAG: TraR/DksA C4-type zinc finger protein [Flavobacteriales bacterium]|nr:TraR/DksA C4-type zinc finger protein [Flavobacteriales bacterium]
MTQEEVKSLILQEIEKTQNKISEYQEMTNPIAPDDAIGRISRMDAINNKSINDAALRKAETKLKNLEYALEKVGNSDFGICAKCKGEIPIQRLILVPQSRFCVNCA